jgi:hypothetical protein
MVGRPRADPEQKQDFGDRTVTQGLDSQRPITEALLWQVQGTVWSRTASLAEAFRLEGSHEHLAGLGARTPVLA